MHHPRRVLGPMEAMHVFFDFAIGKGDAFVLAEVLRPALHHKAFDMAAGMRCILENAPSNRSVTAANAPKFLDAREKCFCVLGVHVVFNLHENRAAFRVGRSRKDRLGPMS